MTVVPSQKEKRFILVYPFALFFMQSNVIQYVYLHVPKNVMENIRMIESEQNLNKMK